METEVLDLIDQVVGNPTVRDVGVDVHPVNQLFGAARCTDVVDDVAIDQEVGHLWFAGLNPSATFPTCATGLPLDEGVDVIAYDFDVIGIDVESMSGLWARNREILKTDKLLIYLDYRHTTGVTVARDDGAVFVLRAICDEIAGCPSLRGAETPAVVTGGCDDGCSGRCFSTSCGE